MIFDFLKKQKKLSEKRKIIEVMILSLNIPKDQKDLYLWAIEILDDFWLEKLYINLSNFSNTLEEEELNNIWKNNFSDFSWMRKKEAYEKKKEINSFSFLISNL